MRQKSIALLLSLSAVLSVASWLSTTTAVYADDPKPSMRNILSATYVEIVIYPVKSGMEQAFLDAMVKSGPFSNQLSGLANEKVLTPLPAAGGQASYFICVDRYYDDVTAQRVRLMRDKAVSSYLVGQPATVNGKLQDHVLANWGWERNTPVVVRDVKPVGSEEVFTQRLTTLSYLKAGYTGQVGIVEFYPAGTAVDTIKSELGARQGLSGASVYSTTSGSLFAYSEYFRSPQGVTTARLGLASAASVSGAQGGVVTVNYTPR